MNQTKKRRVLKKLKKYNTIWHPDSGLVFKSQKERVVTGRIEDEELQEFDQKTVELSKEWGFKMDEESLQQLQNQAEEEEEEEEDQEEEDQEEEEEEDDQEEGESREQTEESGEESEESNNQNDESVDKNNADSQQTAPVLNTELLVKLQNFTDTLKTHLQKETNEKSDLINEKEQLTKQLEELQTKYNIVMKKFETMKSLFN